MIQIEAGHTGPGRIAVRYDLEGNPAAIRAEIIVSVTTAILAMTNHTGGDARQTAEEVTAAILKAVQNTDAAGRELTVNDLFTRAAGSGGKAG